MQFTIQTAQGNQQIDLTRGTFDAMRVADSPNLVAHVEATVGAPLPSQNLPTVGQQLAQQMGIRTDSTLHHAMSGAGYIGPDQQAATVGGDGSVVGRLVTQAVLMQAVETHLRDDLSGYAKMLGDNAALKRSLTTTTWETPILDFKRPANSRPQPIAQLAEPARMLTLTASTKKNAIMGEAIGIEFSDQVTRNVTIDVVALSLKRQAEESAAALAMYQIMSLLNGDVDYGMPALATVVAGGAAEAAVLDPELATTPGKLSQVAWVKWLWRNNLRRTISTVITDLDGAMAIENRIGRPTKDGEKVSSNRIDTFETVINPGWPDKVDVIITQDPSWPAGTIVGFDKKFGYSYITSTAIDYKATEEDLIRRGTRMRFDTGSMVERFMNDAWDILTF